MSKYNVKQLISNDFYCTQCGSKSFNILRKRGQERESGHLKKLYCLKCGCQTNHCEVKPWTKYGYSDFKLEYEYGNFDEDGKRKRTLGQLKELIRNGHIEKERDLLDVRDPGFGQEHLD